MLASLHSLPLNAWLIFPVLVVGLAFTTSLWNWFKNPSAPGPFLARFTNIWQAYRYTVGRFQEENIALHRKYGKIVRLGPDHYSINDPDTTKIIYGHGTQFPKSQWYAAWNPEEKLLDINLFAQRDINQHSHARRRYAHLYAMSSLVGYEPYVNNCIAIFGDVLRRHAKAQTSIDLTRWFQFYAFDVIGEITFSKRFGFMETGRDVNGIIATIASILETSQVVGFFRPLLALMPLLIKLGGQTAFVDFAFARVAEGKKEALHGSVGGGAAEDRAMAPDFLSKLLAMTDSYEASDSKDVVIAGACLQNLFAGSDTTSISLCAIYFDVVSRPEVMRKMRAELDAAAAAGELSDPVTFAQSQKLPYFQAVLKESLRLHPATGLPLWREVPAGGATLCGRYFPPGSKVGVNSWVVHHNEDVFGRDAAEYRAERWLDSPKDRLKLMNELYMPFGLGSRTCIGKNISLLEISKLIPQLVHKFDVELVDPRMKQTGLSARNTWFVKQSNFVVNIRMRADKSGQIF